MKTQRFLTYCLFLIGLLLGSSNAYAQWPGGGATDNLVLVSSTDFSIAGAEDSFYSSTTYINDFDGVILPAIDATKGGYKLPPNAASSLDQGKGGTAEGTFLSGRYYGISYNSRQLDSLRMDDAKGEWGIVFSSGDKGITANTLLLNYRVRGLKNGGKYRVVVEYCNPLNKDYLNQQSKLNTTSQKNKGPYLSSSYNARLKIGTNNSVPDGVDAGVPMTAGDCEVSTINSPLNADNRQGPIANETLDVNIYMTQSGPYAAVKIKSIKVYAELDPKIMGKTSECVGGKNATFKLINTFLNCTYQWYKDGKAITGATGPSYTHTTGSVEGQEYTFYCEVKTAAGDKVKSNTIKFMDKHCCTGDNGLPADEKLIWQDDFGTFTKKGSYWVWDYTDINNPVKVDKTAADGWTYELPYSIPGASYTSTPDGEGTYSVAANVTNSNDPDGTKWGWQAQTFYGKYPASASMGSGTNTYQTPNGYVPDHTASSINAPAGYGAMLFLNCGNDPDAIIYSREINGLCDKNLTVKCYISNWSASDYPVKVKIRVTDLNTGTSHTTDAVERMAVHSDTKYDVETAWEEVSASIELTGDSPSLKFEIISEAGGDAQNKEGNDLLLDDIQIWTCTPPSVKLFFDEGWTVEDTASCVGDDIQLYVEETSMIKNYYKNTAGDYVARYIYQYTFDDPSSKKFDKKSWKPIPGSDITDKITYDKLTELFVGKDPDEKIYFRVVLGSDETLNAHGLNFAYNPDEACASYTVSDPIEVTIKCDACTEPLDKIKIKSDKKASDKKNKKDVIELCYGESVTLSQAADITPDEADWASADFEGFAIKWFETEKPGDMLGAKSVLKDVVSPKVVSYDDASLGGSEMPVVLYAVDALYLDGKCKTADTVYIRFNEVPDAEFRNPQTEFCEGEGKDLVDMTLTKGTASDYTIHWWKGADTLSGSPLGDNKDEKFFEGLESADGGMFSYQVVDNKTGCKGEVKNYEVIVYPIPEAPKDESLQYTINGDSHEMLTPAKFAQTLDASYDLVWFKSEDDPKSKASLTAFEIDRSVATTSPYVFYIAYKEGECISKKAKVVVEVLAAPKPAVKDIDLCKDGTYDAMEGIVSTDAGYELIWFEDAKDTVGKTLSSAPTNIVDVTTPGQYTLYVAQRATTAPYAQSEVAEFKVTVYDVKEPVDASKHEYCANDEAEELKADIVKDEKNYYYADEIVFVSGTSEASTFTPNTKMSSSQTYEYKAYQKFTTPESKKECKGPSIDITVDVVAVEKPKVNHSVSYVKSEAKDTKEFVDILVKSPDAIDDVPGQTLLWSRSETGVYVKGSTISSKPEYNTGNTEYVEKQERWVRWEVTTADGLTCQSEPERVDIIISSTPAPIVKKIEICEEVFKSGSIPSDKEPSDNASVNDNGGSLPNSSSYELVWFDDKDVAEDAMTNSSSLAKGKKTAPALQEVFDGVNMSDETVSEWSKSLYVVQSYDDGANVTTSPASEMKLVVNATPKLQQLAHDPVCDGPVNLTDNKYWNVSNGVTVSARYSYGGSDMTQNASSLTEAGEYTVEATSSLGCKSDPLTLQLDIRKLKISMDPKSETCPGDNVEQEVAIDFSYNKNGVEGKAGKVSLSWTSEEKTSDNPTQKGTVSSPDDVNFMYTSGNFEGKAGDTHTITVTMTDGYCIATAKQTVEIGNGPAGGTYSWTETGNESTENGKNIPLSDSNKEKIEIYACGDAVTVDFSKVTMDSGSKVEWFKSQDYTSTPAKTGTTPTFSKNDYGKYYVRYMNNCYAYATVSIIDASVTINTMSDGSVVKCEDDEYKITIDVESKAGKATREWYKDGNLYANNSDGLSFSPLKKKDEGSYRVEYRYGGCRAELDVVDLKVKEYVKVDVDDYEMYDGKKSYIIIAGENATAPFKFSVPSEASDIAALTPTKTEKTSRNEGSLSSGNVSFDVTAVDEDHIVNVKFESDDYCMGEVDFQVLRDAKLVLKANLDTAMCLNEEKPFTIDTIGTGAFRRPGAELKITATPERGTETQEKGFGVVSDTLKKNISPRETTTYKVSFTYGGQHLDTTIKVTVYNFKVEPINQIICSGEEVELKATVSPAGSKIEWFDEDKTTSLGDNPGMLSPVFDGPVSAQKSQHKYWARPYSDLVTCTSSGMTPLLVDVYRPLEGDIEDQTICEGDNVRVDAGSYGATTYIWIIDGDSIKGSRYYQDTPSETTVYKVHMTRGNVCKADDEATVTVTTKPVIASIDSVGYRDVDIVMDPMFGTPAFRYSIDGGEWTENTHLTGLKYTTHIITVEDANGCVLKDTFVVKDPELVFPIHFSPNGDGDSEHWTVPGINETYPEAEFTIYDRWGKKLVVFKGEDDGWDGSYNGVDMPSTDYWYECIIREIDKVYTGHFTLIRR